MITELVGDGDFRSDEVREIRDKADIIITNPPFSLFREFLAWITEAEKKFLLIGNMNAITYKEAFPLIKSNQMWVGSTSFSKDMLFGAPGDTNWNELPKSSIRTVGKDKYLRAPSAWFTNLDHGRRNQALALMTYADNLRYSKHKELKGLPAYKTYDNYDAIEVPFTDAIPSDYPGVMGVPISFLDKYCPEQFEIVGYNSEGTYVDCKKTYKRLFIRNKTPLKY